MKILIIHFKNGLIFDINKLNNSTIDKINNLLLNEHETIIKLSHEIYFVDKFDNSLIEKDINHTKNTFKKLKIKI